MLPPSAITALLDQLSQQLPSCNGDGPAVPYKPSCEAARAAAHVDIESDDAGTQGNPTLNLKHLTLARPRGPAARRLPTRKIKKGKQLLAIRQRARGCGAGTHSSDTDVRSICSEASVDGVELPIALPHYDTNDAAASGTRTDTDFTAGFMVVLPTNTSVPIVVVLPTNTSVPGSEPVDGTSCSTDDDATVGGSTSMDVSTTCTVSSPPPIGTATANTTAAAGTQHPLDEPEETDDFAFAIAQLQEHASGFSSTPVACHRTMDHDDPVTRTHGAMGRMQSLPFVLESQTSEGHGMGESCTDASGLSAPNDTRADAGTEPPPKPLGHSEPPPKPLKKPAPRWRRVIVNGISKLKKAAKTTIKHVSFVPCLRKPGTKQACSGDMVDVPTATATDTRTSSDVVGECTLDDRLEDEFEPFLHTVTKGCIPAAGQSTHVGGLACGLGLPVAEMPDTAASARYSLASPRGSAV